MNMDQVQNRTNLAKTCSLVLVMEPEWDKHRRLYAILQ